MGTLAAALELLGDDNDLDDLQQRLRSVPPSAASRGLYLRAVERTLVDYGRLDEYQRVFGPRRPPALSYVPMVEYLPRAAGAAVILCGRRQVRKGLEVLGRSHAQTVSRSLLGRALLRMVSPDPLTLLRQGVAAQRQTTTYAHWRLEVKGPRHAVMHFENEWSWIDSVLLGAAKGTFEMVRVPVEVTCELQDPFNGCHVLRWGARG